MIAISASTITIASPTSPAGVRRRRANASAQKPRLRSRDVQTGMRLDPCLSHGPGPRAR